MRKVLAWLFVGSCVWFLYTGQREEKLERPVMLVTDMDSLCEGKRAEYAHTRVLVIHEEFGRRKMQALLNHRELSYGTWVVVSKTAVEVAVKETEEGITKQLQTLTGSDAVKLQSFLQMQYGQKKAVRLPVICKTRRGIEKNGYCLYKDGKIRQSFP
ncbi:hypothetical protein SAMN02910358_00868 [Lachnospiraceae bacterium XBB1006]|nr:hypothetical protein SAMN02910358_00868 [Lachnospiraceae bacterium XBB1006]